MRTVAGSTVIRALVGNAANAENDLGFIAAWFVVLDRVASPNDGLELRLRFLRRRVVRHAGIIPGDPRSVKPSAGDHYDGDHGVRSCINHAKLSEPALPRWHDSCKCDSGHGQKKKKAKPPLTGGLQEDRGFGG